jgi:hypothetical protein
MWIDPKTRTPVDSLRWRLPTARLLRLVRQRCVRENRAALPSPLEVV